MRKTIKIFSLLLLAFLLSCQSEPEPEVECEVLVLGSGTGAIAAALQAARSDAQTILVNPQAWLGGMLTSAGVSATDGNHQLPAGMWGEFRSLLREHYGGADSLFTGWVSNTMFEPKVGARYWEKMTESEPLLSVWNNAHWEQIEKNGHWLVKVQLEDGSEQTVRTKILVDGTDLGDVAEAVGVTFDLGMEAAAQTGEAMAPETANDIVQDLTFVAILKDYGENADRTIPQPEGYDPSVFHCSCRTHCENETAHPCQTMLNYGKLPNNKYMINWPIEGNDYYANVINMTKEERAEVYQQAKLHTLRFVYYIQHELGFRNLGLAEDEFPTEDKLALMPYHREGRRIHGLSRLKVHHLIDPYEYKLYRTGIAVGDYPIDHHHDENPAAPEIDFPPVPSFSIPAGCLIPENVGHLLVADKAISVSNIVNGSSRLQPVIIQIGQAAGLMAALAAQQGVTPAELDVRKVQNEMIQHQGYLLPLIDVKPEHPHFAAIQRIAATGLLRAQGVPFKWANQTWFYPDTSLSAADFKRNLIDFDPMLEDKISSLEKTSAPLTIGQSIQLLYELIQFYNLYPDNFESLSTFEEYIYKNWSGTYQLSNYQTDRLISKSEMAVLLDQLINPFQLKKINFSGDWKI